ncbi:LacI family DNA-binding transcriptional regulator [Streptomyces capparidis]
MPDRPGNARPTLEAVAAHAGVSRATVSRVVNGFPGVRRPLRQRVEQSIAALGYVPNQAARTLVTRRHDAVAVVVAEPESRVFGDPFFGTHLRGMSRELSAADCQLVLLLVETRDDHARVGRYLAGQHVDGAMVFSLHTGDPLPALTRQAGLPTVFGGRPGGAPQTPRGPQPPQPGVPEADGPGELYVDSDNRGGARLAVEHLVSLGRRRIAHISGPLDQTSALDRLLGYRDVLPDADPALTVHGDFTRPSGVAAMERLLAAAPDVDAVFAGNDLMASGALRVLRARGRQVPRDVAVVGFDDVEDVAPWTEPPLTTVHQDVEGMGREMTRLLLRLLGEGPDGLAPVVFPTRLVRRASA